MATNSDFTIADVLAWARTKPADERYSFCDAAQCALGQFLRSERGMTTVEIYVADPFFSRGFDKDRGISDAFQCGTFGGLVARLEKLCPQAPVPQAEWAGIEAYLTDIEAVAVPA